jgi:hypothetical protein
MKTAELVNGKYYLILTIENKWGIALWRDKWWSDEYQDGKLLMGIRDDFIKEYYPLPIEQNTLDREKLPIALITPYKHDFDIWVHDFGIDNEKYVFVSEMHHIDGRNFSAVQRGFKSWMVHNDVVQLAYRRVKPSLTLLSVSESKIAKIILDTFQERNDMVTLSLEAAKLIKELLTPKER